MRLTKYLCEEDRIWPEFQRVMPKVLQTTTILQDAATTATSECHENIDNRDFHRWLTSNPVACQHDSSYSCSLRMIWIRRDYAQRTDAISEAQLMNSIREFELEGVLDYCGTASAGIERVQLSSADSAGRLSRYCFRTHPKIMLLWSFNTETKDTRGICFTSKEYIENFKLALSLDSQGYATFLALACAAVLSVKIDQVLESSKETIRETEVRTGYHRWSSRSEAPATGDLSSLSAKTSGLATKLAATVRKVKIVESLLEFIVEQESGSSNEQISCSEKDKQATIIDDVHCLKQRTESQHVDITFTERRVDIQVSALFNLIAQYDALASHQTASESKIVALASQYDSNSMKTLAVVTIFFLPGQAVASIFAMPLFNWTAGQSSTDTTGIVVNSRFGIYWAVTIPLTAITFGVAVLWLFLDNRQRVLHHARLVADRDSKNNISEVMALARRRSSAGIQLSNTEGFTLSAASASSRVK